MLAYQLGENPMLNPITEQAMKDAPVVGKAMAAIRREADYLLNKVEAELPITKTLPKDERLATAIAGVLDGLIDAMDVIGAFSEEDLTYIEAWKLKVEPIIPGEKCACGRLTPNGLSYRPNL